MLTKPEVLKFLNANIKGGLGYEGKFRLIQEYIKERKDSIYNPTEINVGQLEQAWTHAIKWYMDKYTVCILRAPGKNVDQPGPIIKYL